MAASLRARFSDGQSTRTWSCEIRLESNGLAIDRGSEHDVQIWAYSSLRNVTPKAQGAEMIVERRDAPGAQLSIRDAGTLERLARVAPQLAAPGGRRRLRMVLLAIAGTIAVFIALMWHLEVRPARAIAGLIPDTMRQLLGRSVVAHFKSKGRVCKARAGRQALDDLLARLLEPESDAEPVTITVIELPFENAFATAGGQIVMTAKLITAAQSPDEVAGVLAHEIGHGIERHPEVGLVRGLGFSLLVELFAGGTGLAGRFTSQVLQTGYVRQDERAADDQALRLLKQAGISQRGIENFFERLAKKSKKPAFQAFDLLQTHPYASDRLAVVRRSTRYATRPSLNTAQWRALRAICTRK